VSQPGLEKLPAAQMTGTRESEQASYAGVFHVISSMANAKSQLSSCRANAPSNLCDAQAREASMSAPGNSNVPLPIPSISRMLFRITRETQVGITDCEPSR
jgi:hypothetical protein